jgi:hypothetical protein
MSPQKVRIIFNIAAVFWVGGWGLLAFRHPQFFAKINMSLGFRKFATPRFVTITSWFGLVAMILAAISLIDVTLVLALGRSWY